jgi:hypothetical protein
MSHKDALARLIPVDLGGVSDSDLTVEGDQLDLVTADIEALRLSIITDIVTILPQGDDRLKMTPVRWSIHWPFYIALAASLGYKSAFYNAVPDSAAWSYFSAGVSGAGDSLASGDDYSPWTWLVVISSPGGASVPSLEAILTDLAPAHILMLFSYVNA